ncbi:hypothetical protein GCM10009836_68470 [Pseudonocardia ailaonensis]|uniref:Uncharacterized protein n=1 Tax=Pseudonocardia ailaonensis TaxID=367279 RepID=A0ABN2NQG7_9PSEU
MSTTTDTTQCPYCHGTGERASIERAPAQPPTVLGRRIRAVHRGPRAVAFDEAPSAGCNDIEIDDEGVWEYIGEDETTCYYWGPADV